MGIVLQWIALRYYEEALPIQRAAGDRDGESVTRFNIAMIYKQSGRLEEAEAELQQVVTLDEAIGRPNLKSDRAELERVRELRRQGEASGLDQPSGS